MRDGLQRVFYRRGYEIYVLETGHIYIGKEDDIVLHANCEVMENEEEILEVVDYLISAMEDTKRKDSLKMHMSS